MAYIGNQSPTQFTSLPSKEDFTGQSGSSITLSNEVAGPQDISLYINNVRQEPTESYSVAGNVVTFNGYTISASDNVYVTYNALAVQTIVPPDGSVTKAKIGTTELDLATIKDSSGTNTAMTIDSGGRILQPTKPIFRVVKRASSGSGGVSGDITFNEAPINVGSNWDTSNHYFVAPIAGHYQFSFVGFGSDSDGTQRTSGSVVAVGLFKYTGGAWVDETEMYQKVQAANWVNSSFTHITHLAVNERVKINVRIGYVYYDNSTRDYIVFSGHLIG